MSLIRGISGIRGIVDKSLTKSIINLHVQAFSEIQNPGTILLARDSRAHGEVLINIAAEALKESGRDVINYDIIPTPTAQFLVQENNFSGGIVITASHNPLEWNGMKFIEKNGCFLDAEKNKNLFSIADTLSLDKNSFGSVKNIDNGYIDHINHTVKLSCIDSNAIKKRKFKVVVDAVNGAASIALPSLLESLGCLVKPIHCIPDGTFPRGAEPLPNNLIDLGNAVKKHDADIGIATDPDGDRLAIVDENGNPLGEEYTLVICADGYFKSSSFLSPIITNLSTTMAMDKIAEKYGVKVIRSAVGEINVVNKMIEVGALFGGEGNGGVILSESHYGRDSLVGTAMILNRMIQDNMKVSEIFNSMPQYVIVKDKISIKGLDPELLIKKVELEYKNNNLDFSDGLKVSWENSWVHIRKSNTEPIIRIYAEAATKQDAKKIVNNIKKLII